MYPKGHKHMITISQGAPKGYGVTISFEFKDIPTNTITGKLPKVVFSLGSSIIYLESKNNVNVDHKCSWHLDWCENVKRK